MVHLAILPKKGGIIDRSLDAQDEAEFVIHFQRDWPHLVFDTRPPLTHLIQAITHLALVVAMQLASPKGGDVGRFDGVNEGFQEMWVKGLLRRLEDHIGGKFSLPNRPAIGQVQGFDHRAVPLRQLRQLGL
jgi:hypothetical protein